MDEQRENVENRNMQEQETPMASAHLSERREMRYEVPIEIEISGLDRKGLVFHERTLTRNVSEWGCGFTTLVELKVDDIIALRVFCPEVEESLPPAKIAISSGPRDAGGERLACRGVEDGSRQHFGRRPQTNRRS
jgi:hypothetical protein